jgi:electron-transferring-flavoprotein dehydrogenase
MSEVAELAERESMEFDVVIVGAGPAGLSAAIRLKQLDPELSVVVLEKGGEVGAHILSGAVVDPVGIDRLIPDWRDDPEHPFKTAVNADHFLVLGPAGSVRLPNFLMPPLMNNHGNYHRLAGQCLPLARRPRRGAGRGNLSRLCGDRNPDQ